MVIIKNYIGIIRTIVLYPPDDTVSIVAHRKKPPSHPQSECPEHALTSSLKFRHQFFCLSPHWMRRGSGPDLPGSELLTDVVRCVAVKSFFRHRSRAAGREETIIEHIKTAAFLLHQTNIMKHTGQPFIASTAGMQNILRGDPEGQAARVDHLQMIRVQIKKDIATLGIGSMHQSVDQQLPDNFLIKGG